jgi:hypothetical protein
MLKTTKFLIATALATLIAAPALAQSLTYVGNSDETFTGRGGILAFHKACDATFPGSQFCTSEDIFRGGGFPIKNELAWVHPIVLGGDSVTGRFYLYIGRDIPYNDISCLGWSSNNTFGLTIDGFNDGVFDFEGCANAKRVACCSQKEAKKGK